MSKAARISTCIFFALGMAACGPKEGPAKSPTPTVEETDAAPSLVAGIRFDIEPSDAEVVVDGESLGSASELMARGLLDLEPGIHQIMIQHEDFETARVEVTVAETTEVLQLSLRRKSP
jgi:hypothetical protein